MRAGGGSPTVAVARCLASDGRSGGRLFRRFQRGARATTLALATMAASSVITSAARAVPQGIHKIQHVVMIMQENRSQDTYFGTYPGADGIPAGTCVPDPGVHGSCLRPFYQPG